MSRRGSTLAAVTGMAALVTLSCLSFASATHLEVDGGVIQYAALDGPPAPTGPPAFEACGDNTQFDNVIVGSEVGETLHGTPGRDIIAGLGGDDVLHGDNQDDCILGGDGNDELHGENGQDLLLGGPGDDVLLGGTGQDVLHGGEGDDNLDGGNGPDQLHGGAGTNTCVDSNGPDSLTDCASDAGSRVATDRTQASAASAPAPPAASVPAPAVTDPPPVINPSAVTDSLNVPASPSGPSPVVVGPAASQGDPGLTGAKEDQDRPHAEVDGRDETSVDTDADPVAGDPET